MLRFVGFLLLTAACCGTTLSQNLPKDSGKPDAAVVLQEVKDKYTQAKFYNIEAVEEWEFRGDLSRQWSKSFLNAAVASGNRYRFEGRGDYGWMMKISDGKTEWIVNPLAKMYTQKPAPDAGPSEFKGGILMDQMALTQAQNLANNLLRTLGNVLNPVYLEDETLTLSGKQVPCYVVGGPRKFRGMSRDQTSQVTVWIDKETRAVRKVLFHLEGALTMNAPYRHTIQDETTVYPVAELGSPSPPDSVFKFSPPAEARLVEEFPKPAKSGNTALIGKPAPEVKFHASDGKPVALSGFRGKPVLLDFWATWCGPCVASLPGLERLFREASGRGLVLLSIDEDEDAKTAAEFWAKHAETWPNFHDNDGGIQREFASGEGIPEFVLIDATGKITYTTTGFDESELRTAIAKLGPEFASLDDAKPKP